MGWLNNTNLVERFTFLTMNISRKWGTQKLCGYASRHYLKIKIRLIMHRIPPNHLIDLHILRKKSPYSELFWSAFFPHFPAFGLNTERLSLRIQENARKVRTRITSNTDTFYAVYVMYHEKISKFDVRKKVNRFFCQQRLQKEET